MILIKLYINDPDITNYFFFMLDAAIPSGSDIVQPQHQTDQTGEMQTPSTGTETYITHAQIFKICKKPY